MLCDIYSSIRIHKIQKRSIRLYISPKIAALFDRSTPRVCHIDQTVYLHFPSTSGTSIQTIDIKVHTDGRCFLNAAVDSRGDHSRVLKSPNNEVMTIDAICVLVYGQNDFKSSQMRNIRFTRK